MAKKDMKELKTQVASRKHDDHYFTANKDISSSAHSSLADLSTEASPDKDFQFLEIVLAGFQDGLIISDGAGEIKKVNVPAKRICEHLLDHSLDRECSQKTKKNNRLPSEIWSICQSALENQNALALKKICFDVKINLDEGNTIRVRVKNVFLSGQLYFLIILEDSQWTFYNKALSDGVLFQLTEREVEVWKLRLQGKDYKEISEVLEISANTVKKHTKNILAKRRTHRRNLGPACPESYAPSSDM